MRAIRNPIAILGLAVAAVLIAGLATNLLHNQAQGRKTLRDALDRRAELTGRLIGSAFMAGTSPQAAAARFGGPPRSLPRRVAGDAGDQSLFVLDARGRVLASRPPEIATQRDLVARSPHLRAALAGAPRLSDALPDGRGGWRIEIAVPFDTPWGRRVLAGGGPVEIVRSFADGFFTAASATPGSQGYLLDGRGRTLSATSPAGRDAKPSGDLIAALARRETGSYGERTFVSAPVPSSNWRVVLSVPTARLYAPIDGGLGGAAWQLFAAFTVAICGLLGLGLAAARGARRLAASTERERAARQLAHERLHDALTGLPNRTLFQDRAEHAVATASRRQRALAVLFMDIDHFKRINDSLGHDAGDSVLRDVARRLDRAVRGADTVSRFGGDEFVVLYEDVEDRGVMRLAAGIQESLRAPILVGERQVPVTFSIGVALHDPADAAATASDLVRNADAAMYRAKDRGRGRIEVFDRELHEQAMRRLDAEVALRQAIKDRALVVHYQPIVALADRRPHGVEALVRWPRPETGELVMPADFIGLAEETGLIGELGEWVLRTAVREVGDWAERGLVDRDFQLSVNVSARQLADPRLPDVVADVLAGWDRPADRLCLEITESAVMTDPSTSRQMLDRLHALGVQLALDDFGVGHSSLGQLARSMPISILKLDRSFVAGMAGRRDRGILEAAAALARALDLTGVAEGVESEEQANALAAMGFPYAQGFHFGRPTPAAQLVEQLARPAVA